MYAPRGWKLIANAVEKAIVSAEHLLWRGRAQIWGIALLSAAITGLVAPSHITGLVRAVCVWDVATIILLALFWTQTMSADPQRTSRRAAAHDPGRNLILILILISCAIGLFAAIGILGQEQHYASHNQGRLVFGLGLIAIMTSWALIHSAMTFRYAHLYYYDDGKLGGIKFPGTEEPSDYDFAYFSFVIGMTFQVSDVEITDPKIRRVVLMHGLIAFAFNAAIIAVTVNIATGLLH